MKRLLWIAVLAFSGIGALLLRQTTPRTPAPASAATASPKKASEFATDGSRIKKLSPEGLAAQKRYEELKKKSAESTRRRDESFRKVAASSTPESRARQIDNLIKLREPGYQRLFASWNLNDQQAKDTLAIIRERELQKSEHRNELFKDATKNMKSFQSNSLVEEMLAQSQLETLLGKSRYADLIAAEQQMFEVEAARLGIRLPVRTSR